MAPTKKNGKNKGCSAINEAVTREYTINIHRGTHRVGFKKADQQALKEIGKFAMKQRGSSNIHIDARLKKAIWFKGTSSVPCCVWVQLSRKT